jgi:hypothetical protein
MPRRVGRPRKRTTAMRGGDFRSVIRSVGRTLGRINTGLKKTKLISRVANGLATIGVPHAGLVGSVAGHLGYGKRRRRVRTRRIRRY